MALCVGDVLNALQLPAMANDMLALADRIARNREIAGLHYPSDSAAGVALATAILPLLKTPLPPGPGGAPKTWYQLAFDNAYQEWNP